MAKDSHGLASQHPQRMPIRYFLKHFFRKIQSNFFLVSLASLIWLVFRTGTKPSRIAYPCQRVAAANVGALVGALPALLGAGKCRILFRDSKKKRALATFLVIAATFNAFAIAGLLITRQSIAGSWAAYSRKTRAGPIGKRIAAMAGAAYATIPAANLLPSPHRVVSVHDSNATSWNGAGNPADYMNQTEINNMVQRGVMELTGQATPLAAWQMLIPYQTGDAVAIKMNFNNVPNCDFTENANMNAYAAVANAVIQGLESIGVPPGKIWITDPSRPINDGFRAGISDANVAYYTKCTAAEIGSRHNVFTTGYISETSPDATLFNPAYGLTDPYRYVLPAQVFEDAAHIINIPQLKGHGSPPDVGGVTLGVKNHFGSVSLTSDAEGDSPLHSNSYFFQMMGDINANPVFYNKTRLVIGDGIMGNPTINWQDPVLWSTFGNEPPALFFFGVDPIAVDSVMFDYIQRECAATSQPARDDKVESYAASLGLGVLEHWDNGTDRQYQIIDYHEIDFDKGPQANLSASSLSWGSQIVGTSSSSQTLRLWNNGNPPLTISGMNTSGDFAETDNCESSVPAGTNCTINVTFLPTAAGSRTGALTISDNAAGSPQTVSFSGSGAVAAGMTSPSQGSTLPGSSVMFQWSAASGASGY